MTPDYTTPGYVIHSLIDMKYIKKSLTSLILRYGIFFPCITIIILSGSFFSVVTAANPDFTLDFEERSLDGWHVVSGDAFTFQPTLGDNPSARNRGQPSNHHGNWWIGTYEKYQGLPGQKPGEIQGDAPQGILESALFTVEDTLLQFFIGGGSGKNTRVDLVILDDPTASGIIAESASGKNTETMEETTWDLSPYAGKTAKIRIIDLSSDGWGHINVDHFRFIPKDSCDSDICTKYSAIHSELYHDIVIYSVPSQAHLIVDTIPYGDTPTTVRVTPGSHTITLQKSGYQELSLEESFFGVESRQYTMLPVPSTPEPTETVTTPMPTPTTQNPSPTPTTGFSHVLPVAAFLIIVAVGFHEKLRRGP